MHVISRKRIREFCEVHNQAAEPLDHWYRLTKRARWESLADLRRVFPAADYVDGFIIFNVGGNKYRLKAKVIFRRQKVYVLQIETHAEYDKGKWKS
jgi:mRNA interferase HigB